MVSDEGEPKQDPDGIVRRAISEYRMALLRLVPDLPEETLSAVSKELASEEFRALFENRKPDSFEICKGIVRPREVA